MNSPAAAGPRRFNVVPTFALLRGKSLFRRRGAEERQDVHEPVLRKCDGGGCQVEGTGVAYRVLRTNTTGHRVDLNMAQHYNCTGSTFQRIVGQPALCLLLSQHNLRRRTSMAIKVPAPCISVLCVPPHLFFVERVTCAELCGGCTCRVTLSLFKFEKIAEGFFAAS